MHACMLMLFINKLIYSLLWGKIEKNWLEDKAYENAYFFHILDFSLVLWNNMLLLKYGRIEIVDQLLCMDGMNY